MWNRRKEADNEKGLDFSRREEEWEESKACLAKHRGRNLEVKVGRAKEAAEVDMVSALQLDKAFKD